MSKVKNYNDFKLLRDLPSDFPYSPKALKWLDNCPADMKPLEWLENRLEWEFRTTRGVSSWEEFKNILLNTK